MRTKSEIENELEYNFLGIRDKNVNFIVLSFYFEIHIEQNSRFCT